MSLKVVHIKSLPTIKLKTKRYFEISNEAVFQNILRAKKCRPTLCIYFEVIHHNYYFY